MEKNWMGYEYITQEGNDIIKKALAHYKARLENITRDKNVIELGASFVGLIEQESQKNLAAVNLIIEDILSGDSEKMKRLERYIPIFDKALSCLKYDISKTEGSIEQSIADIDTALKKISEYN